MAIQIRNTIFDPANVGLLGSLTSIITALDPAAFTKRVPSPGREDPTEYEGVGPNCIIRIEVPYAKATVPGIAALEAVLTGSGAIIVSVVDGWNAGSDNDLRE